MWMHSLQKAKWQLFHNKLNKISTEICSENFDNSLQNFTLLDCKD